MIKTVYTLALIASLSISLAFASGKKKDNSPSSDAYTTTAEATADSADPINAKPCVAERQQEQKPVKQDNKPAEPTEEQNYGRELLGIYG